MARAKVAPITFDQEPALWLQDYLLSQPDGVSPFDWPDPAMLLLDSLYRSGWDMLADPETKARILWLQTLLDAGVDSFVLTASIWEHLLEKPYLIDPEYYKEDWANASKEASDFVYRKIGHQYWVSLSHALPQSLHDIGNHFGGRVLNLIQGDSEGNSAKATAELLVTSHKDWRARHHSPTLEIDHEERRGKLFKEMGPKKAALYLLRLKKAGVREFADIHDIGIPSDVHAVVMSYCLGAMSFDQPVTRDRALKQLNRFWGNLCGEHKVNNTELYWKLWVFGRRFCRPANCAVCPIRQLHETKGRIATSGYYATEGSRTLHPEIILPQNTLELEPEFLLKYAPESKVPGLRITEQTLSFVQRELDGFQLSLTDGEPEAPAFSTEEDVGDPFEDD